MDLTFIFIFSILLQLLAAILAWRLVWIAQKKAAWALIAVAVSLIILQRSISFYHRSVNGYPFDPTADLLSLCISSLMLTGIIRIGPLFISAKSAEEARQESEERFQAIVESATDAIIVFDGTGKIVSWNQGAQTIFGHTAEEILGQPAVILLPENYRQAKAETLERFWATGESPNIGKPVEVEGRKKDGSLFPLECSVNTWETAKGKFFSAVGRDITRRKYAEEILRQQHEFEQTLIDTIPFPVFYKDAEGLYLGCNKAYEEFFGWTKESIIGKSVHDVALKENADVYYAKDRELFENPGTQKYEFVIKDKDGKVRNVIFYKASFPAPDGSMGGIIGSLLDITERKRAEDISKLNELRLEALQKLNQMAESPLQEIAAFALEEATRLTGSTIGYVAFMNEDETVLTMHAWSKTAMEECGIKDFTHNFPLETTGLWGEAVRQRRAVITNDYTAPSPLKRGCPEGHVPLTRHMNAPIFDGQKIVIVAGVGNKPTDYDESDVRQLTILMEGMWRIIQRNRAEEALRDNEQFLSDIFDSIQDGMSVLATDFSIIRVNRTMEDFGYAQPIVGRKCYEVYHNRTSPCEICPVRQTLQTGEVSREIVTEHLADGDRLMEIFAFPLINPTSGQVQAVIEYVRDVTEQKLAKMAIQESEERYRTLVENISYAIVQIDADHHIKMINNASLKMYSKPLKEVIGRECFRVFEKREAICPHCPGQQAMATGCPAEAETEGVRDDGSRFPVRISAFPLFEPSGKPKGFIEIVEDITERRKLMEERLRLSKLESLGLLAGGIAHDFNNILTAILGNISLAMLDIPPAGRLRDRLEGSEKACLQAQALAQQLLTFAKGGVPVKKLISLAELIQESTGFACRGSQARCDYSLVENLWAIEADPGQIRQVFQNLLINAIQSMPTGGTVKISAVNRRFVSENDLSLQSGNYVKITIQDQGIGIPPEYVAKIFDPYFTTKQAGSGLGLATTYSIIKNHNGHISLESKLGEGTTFHIYLPATDQSMEPHSPGDQQLFAGKGRILVMDDEEVVRNVLGEMLTSLGYDANFARDGDEAIQKVLEARENGEKFAAAILDLTVPGGMGGKETSEQLRQIDPQIKSIVSSGYSDDPVMADFSKYGFSGVIAKPYKVSDLSSLLHELTDDKTSVIEEDQRT